jgi:hypothetical protein
MKLITLLLILSLNLNAQEYQKVSTSTKVIGVTLGSVLLNAAGDGLNDNGVKGWGHLLNAASIATLLTLPLMVEGKETWPSVLTYIGFRYVFFNATYNTVRELPYDYTGTTEYGDRAMAKVPKGFQTFTKVCVLAVTVSIPINHLNYKKLKHFNRNKVFIN